MTTPVNRQWRFLRHPDGLYQPSDFEWREEAVPEVADGEVLVRNLLLSLDPTNRAWGFKEDTYMPSLAPGQVMRGLTIGVVEASRHPGFREGDYVSGITGWQDYLVSGGGDIHGLDRDPDVPLTTYLGLLGHIGLTAHYGLLEIGRPEPGQTVVVSAAAGATGSLVGQIAGIKGCRTVGIAGGEEKCRRLTEEFGFDEAVDYKRESVVGRLAELCPDGIDIYYDNVGGELLEAALDNLAMHARIVIAGQIAMYNDQSLPGPRNLFNLISKRARMEAFVVLDFMDDAEGSAAAIRELTGWYREGRLRFRTHVIDGLENAVTAVNMLFDGSNQGKLMVRIADDPGEG